MDHDNYVCSLDFSKFKYFGKSFCETQVFSQNRL